MSLHPCQFELVTFTLPILYSKTASQPIVAAGWPLMAGCRGHLARVSSAPTARVYLGKISEYMEYYANWTHTCRREVTQKRG